MRFGGEGSLVFSDVQTGTDGIVKGFRAFAQGGMPPRVARSVPDWSADAGATLYASWARVLFLDASLYHTQQLADSSRGWLYGGARAYAVVPLGMQLGTRGGAGLYLDKAYPALEYREMARVEGKPGGRPYGIAAEGAGIPGALRAGALPPDPGTGLTPRQAGFGTLIDWGTSRTVGVGLSLKTLAFSGRPATWSAFLRFDAGDFGREPAWAVDVSL
jgi:hypothetical protein